MTSNLHKCAKKAERCQTKLNVGRNKTSSRVQIPLNQEKMIEINICIVGVNRY